MKTNNTQSSFNSDHTIRQYAHGLLLESQFLPSSTDCLAVQAKISKNGRLGGRSGKTGSRNMAATQKINFLTHAVPIHSFRHFFARTYRFATIQNVTDDRQTDDRQTDRRHIVPKARPIVRSAKNLVQDRYDTQSHIHKSKSGLCVIGLRLRNNIYVLSVLRFAMADDLKSFCSFLVLLQVVVFILLSTVLSHSHGNYNDALRNNRGKLFIAWINTQHMHRYLLVLVLDVDGLCSFRFRRPL